MGVVHKVFHYCSAMAVKDAIRQDPRLQQMWDLSLTVLPDLTDHYATVSVDAEGQMRLRLLLCAQAVFMRKVVDAFKSETLNGWVDVGDSDGAARQLFLKSSPEMAGFRTLGVNLEPEAVALIRSKGLEAECLNAMDLNRKGVACDLVSVFETLEHIPDPVGFLERMQEVVGRRLVVSVPLIAASRVGLRYLTPKWEPHKRPSYSNNHVFELSPSDWTKIFRHTGWAVEDEWKVRQYPDRGPLKWLMQAAWRRISFEGYFFVVLKKDTTDSARFSKG
jgi:hypothetical protein